MLLVLTGEVEACAILPLGAGHTDAGLRNPGPMDEAVVALTKVIATLLFTYPQVREYSSSHF